jgi:hypothetical protein
MIDGITVLNQIPIQEVNYIIKLGVTLFILGFVSFIISVLVIIAGGYILSTGKPIITGYKYQVTISDTIELTDFNQKYDIISQKGQIYTIREKE